MNNCYKIPQFQRNGSEVTGHSYGTRWSIVLPITYHLAAKCCNIIIPNRDARIPTMYY